MFKRKSIENHDQASNIEKVAVVAAIGGAVVALAMRASRRIPRNFVEMTGGHTDQANAAQPETTATED